MDSKPPYPRLSTSLRLKHLEKERLRKLSEAPSAADTEMQPSKADKAMVTSESDSDDELFGYDPNFEINASAKRQRIATSSKQPSETSDSDDEVLDFDPNFATSAKKTSSPKTQLETSTTTATSTVTESFDSKQPSTTDTETQQHSEHDNELDENESSIDANDSSDDENESSSDENDSSDDENEEGSPVKQINPPAMEMIAEVFVDILLEFIDKHNAKLGIISSEFPKERLRSILMGTERSFEDMPSMFDIILLVLHLVSSVCGDMEDGGRDMDAFASNEEFQNDFLDDVFAFLEPFSGLFSNKRLNNHHGMKTHRFAASTLLEFLYGRIDMTEDEIKLYCALVLGGFLDGDGSTFFGALRSSRWIDGETKQNAKKNIVNYHCAGKDATLEEIVKYLLEHPTSSSSLFSRIHQVVQLI
ncbi:predicted protein [Chaetoceros tenuissimus]|uniref:Uncharacterized protein n=1 Tax=Chaetoceros tenuissimus TaxID=426638 RepID=A0AAD3CL58_9STRA|nr:predicted protein [Chaetoceros tenuissimus]